MKCWKRSVRRGRLRRAAQAFPLLTFSILPIILLATGLAFPQETLRTQSNIVLVPALVSDHQGEIIYGLQAKDFVIEDDGVPQTLTLDESPEGQPVSLVIAVQRGRRANYEFPRIRGLSSMLDPLAQSHTRIALVEFDSRIELARMFTSDASLVVDDLKNLEAGDSGAAILDAIAYSVDMLGKEPRERQRVLLLISETRDHGSVAKIDDVVAAIGRSNTVVDAQAFSPSLSNILDTERGTNEAEMHPMPDLLAPLIMARQAMRKNIPETVASLTGGEYELFATRKRFELRMNAFTNHLHNRYLLSFAPQNPHPGMHRLSVRLALPGTSMVVARTSYWVKIDH
jgi:VWFA-related protein